jgi:hypothetical protein
MFLLALGSSSCSKSVTVPDSTGHQQIFIRIAQVDKDGTISFSKVINAVLQ